MVDVVQLVEHRIVVPSVVGSSPSGRDFKNKEEQMSNNEQSFLDGIKTYFKGVKLEWGKITWPERRQVFVETLYVVFICFVFTLAILLMDLIFKGLFSFLHK